MTQGSVIALLGTVYACLWRFSMLFSCCGMNAVLSKETITL
jgi:hypothetical protein